MARTRQTAHKTTGGQAPHKEVVRSDQPVVESDASSSMAVRHAPVHQVRNYAQFTSVAYRVTAGVLLHMH
jgi:hypothetical protein